MKITSTEQYKEMQRARQKLLDEVQKRRATRHLKKMAHEAKLAKEREQREVVPEQLPLIKSDSENV